MPNWIYYKVKSPRIFKEGLKMPDYYFAEEESTAGRTCIPGLKGKQLPASYTLPFGERRRDYATQGTFGKIPDRRLCLVCRNE